MEVVYFIMWMASMSTYVGKGGGYLTKQMKLCLCPEQLTLRFFCFINVWTLGLDGFWGPPST